MSQHSFKPVAPLITSAGTVYPRLPGTTYEEMGRFSAPTDGEIRGMLADLRAQPGWSQRLTSAVIGCGFGGLQQWEVYQNASPSGTARKLIWLLHQTLILGNTLDPIRIATWGKLDGIPIEKLKRLIDRTTPRLIAEPEHGQGGTRGGGKVRRPPVSGGEGGGARKQGDGVTRNSEHISTAVETGVTLDSTHISGLGVSGKGEVCPRQEGGKSKKGVWNGGGAYVKETVDLRKVQVVLGHGRVYMRARRRTERARKKELGKAYKRVKYEVPEGVKDGDDSWKWG